MQPRKFKVKNFGEFLTESEDSFFSQIFKRFYMLVRKPYPVDSENLLGRMIGEARNVLFDQVCVSEENWDKLSFFPGVPVLNFTEDNHLVQLMLEKGAVDSKSLYNHPQRSSLVSDKVIFHKTFLGCDFIPLTVFSSQEVSKLKFPVIAKPAQGKSAEGIQKFESHEDLKSSTLKFDLFSEMIDLKREFRCFCFRDKILEINERIKVEGSQDFLSKADAKTDFYYKEILPEEYENIEKLKEILDICRNLVNLEFFSLDFAETSNGDLYVIEMNSRTGMGVEKMVDLYESIYKDFYKIPLDEYCSWKLAMLASEWEKAYEQEKGSRIDECTTVAGNLGGSVFLFKNRDRSYTPDSKIVREKIDGVEVVYYTDQTGWVEGMNEHGVGFVFSQLTEKLWKGYRPSYTVSDEPKNDSRFLKFQGKIKKVLASKNVQEAIQKLKDSEKSGSFLLSDKKDTYEVEVFKGSMRKRKLSFDENPYYVKTNHGELIPRAGHQPSGESIKRASSSIRRHQASLQLQGIQDISEIPSRMKFQAYDASSSLNVFRTDNEEVTISQCLMDLSHLQFYFFHDSSTADSVMVEDNVKDSKIKIDVRKV
jgi:hypothetical protein